MDPARRAFYEYHAAMMEPWDGPAAVAFTDGRQIGAMLDRNGLRPARYIVTSDGLVVLASEAGVLPIAEERIITKWRLQPGRMLLVDLEQGRIISDDEIKHTLAASHPYAEWVKRTQIVLGDMDLAVHPRSPRSDVTLLDRQQAFGYSRRIFPSCCADGGDRPGSGRVDGHRHADFGIVDAVEAPLHLFQAGFRAGNQSADRPDPRGIGHEPRVLHRAAPQHPRS
jgi:hypothetical protein